MVREDTLSSVLSEFARTLTTDFPVQAILDHLVGRIVDVLPVSAAGVTLISDGEAPQYVAASDESALRFERLQTQVDEGPCLSAYTTGASVSVPDLATDLRFPTFAPLAVEAGLAAVWTFPLRGADGRLGALDLYNDHAGALGGDDMEAAQTLADVAAAYVWNAHARDEARVVSEAYQHLALHDALTGLPNRALLEERLEHAALRAQRSHSTAAVLFADLDGFKLVNDTFGHRAGDELLVAVAQRLSHLVRPGDTLARVSGDEFVFLCEDLADVADAETLVRRIAGAFSSPFALGAQDVQISASVGLAFAGRGEAITTQLVADADADMYRSKRTAGAGRRVVDPTRVEDAADVAGLRKDLRRAVTGGRLSLHYQPIVRLADGLVEGVEALLRWEDPVRGWVPPAAVVAVAEDCGLIEEIGAWVLDRACRDRGRWLGEHPSHPLDVSVNLSGQQLRATAFLDTVLSVLERTGTDPTVLLLEITEDALVEDGARVMAVLAQLRGLGVRLALEGLGTGSSSFDGLRHLPVDVVKIDRSLVVDSGRNRSTAAVVEAIVQLAHVLELSVTAGGVETEGQQQDMCELRCDMAQGFVFCEPLPAQGISDLLAGAVGPLRLHHA